MTYSDKINQLAQKYQDDYNVTIMATEYQRCCHELEMGQLLTRPLPMMRLSNHDWWEFQAIGKKLNQTAAESTKDFNTLQALLYNLRKFLQYHYGQWTLISQQALRVLTHYWPQKSYLELMSGNGQLANALAQRGQKVIATDSMSWRSENLTGRRLDYPVLTLEATAAIEKYATQVDFVLLSWSPNNDPIDWQIYQYLRTMANPPQLLVIGERFGVTNSELFWRSYQPNYSPVIQQVNRYLPATIEGVHEQLYLYRFDN